MGSCDCILRGTANHCIELLCAGDLNLGGTPGPPADETGDGGLQDCPIVTGHTPANPDADHDKCPPQQGANHPDPAQVPQHEDDPSGFGPAMAYGQRPQVLYGLDGRTQVKYWRKTELPEGHTECSFCPCKDTSLTLHEDMQTAHKCKPCHQVPSVPLRQISAKLPSVGAGKKRCMRCHFSNPADPEAAIKSVDEFPNNVVRGVKGVLPICISCKDAEAKRQQACSAWRGARICKPAHGCGRLLPGKAFTGSLEKCIACVRSISAEELCRRTKLLPAAKQQAALDAGEVPVRCAASLGQQCCRKKFSPETFTFNLRGRGTWNMSCDQCHERRSERKAKVEANHAEKVGLSCSCFPQPP